MAEKKVTKKINKENSWPSSEEEGELAIDLYEIKDDLVLQAAIGGVVIGDLDISITNDMITIKGKREREEESKIEKFYYNECFYKAKATVKNGLLSIYLPKLVKTKKKTLKIEEE